MRRETWVALWVAGAVTCGWGQGALTPSGAPGATMKTLLQMAPATPIDSAPFTITAPGAYVLTSNLVSSGHGLVIQSDNVTVDLNGFALTSTGGGSFYGVYLEGTGARTVNQVSVRNGSLRGFQTGIWLSRASGCRFEQVNVLASGSYGVLFYGGYGACDGNQFTACNVIGSGGLGLYLSGNGSSASGNVFEECCVSGCADKGVQIYRGAGKCEGNRFAGCIIHDNGGYGLIVSGGLATDVRDCLVGDNGSSGIRFDNSSDFNTVVNCLVCENRTAGIVCMDSDGNRIERNLVSRTGGAASVGILSESTSADNLVFRNFCQGQTNNFSLRAADVYGPAVTNRGALATGGEAAHPWANFSR